MKEHNWWLVAPFSEQTRKDTDLNYQLSGGYMSVYLRNSQNYFGVPLRAGLKFKVEDVLFDLCGQEPQKNMDIYITEDGKLSCGNPKHYICHFIGNVKLESVYQAYQVYRLTYSVYVVSIIKGDRKPAKCSVEIGGIK